MNEVDSQPQPNAHAALQTPTRKRLLLDDTLLLGIMGTLAGCGLIYEYLLSYYAGRVLGAVETTLFAMIGIMIVAMGVGAFLARWFRSPFSAFAWLETLIALIGSTSILVIAAAFALTALLPDIVAEQFALPADLAPQGGWISDLSTFIETAPFVIGFILGALIGMEIPLIARVREHLHQKHLLHNAGTIYGADYIGAGLGAAVWVFFMLQINIHHAAALTACVNLIAGLIFILRYREHVRRLTALLIFNVFIFFVVILVAFYGGDLEHQMEDMLYTDKVVFSTDTQHQHLTITRRILSAHEAPIYSLFINGRTQFSSGDEHIYHSFLVYPAMTLSAKHERVLIIGGGDGLALRDALKWQPKEVVLLDLDPKLVSLFKSPLVVEGEFINRSLLELNEYAFSDPRVSVRYGDAFISVDQLIRERQSFDTIIVDLPDPNHPNLNKLYSSRFYNKLKMLLNPNGALSVQSTSPYHAQKAFLSIAKTLRHAGFSQVEQYHHNVPSFGEWGWSIATLQTTAPSQRLRQMEKLPVEHHWLTLPLLLASFEFGADFFNEMDAIEINRLGSHVLYQYYQQGWRNTLGG